MSSVLLLLETVDPWCDRWPLCPGCPGCTRVKLQECRKTWNVGNECRASLYGWRWRHTKSRIWSELAGISHSPPPLLLSCYTFPCLLFHSSPTWRLEWQAKIRSACVQPSKVIPLSFIYRLLVWHQSSRTGDLVSSNQNILSSSPHPSRPRPPITESYWCNYPAQLTTAAGAATVKVCIVWYQDILASLTGLPPRWFIRFEHCALRIHIHLCILVGVGVGGGVGGQQATVTLQRRQITTVSASACPQQLHAGRSSHRWLFLAQPTKTTNKGSDFYIFSYFRSRRRVLWRATPASTTPRTFWMTTPSPGSRGMTTAAATGGKHWQLSNIP